MGSVFGADAGPAGLAGSHRGEGVRPATRRLAPPATNHEAGAHGCPVTISHHVNAGQDRSTTAR
jgi:hypothetical protein